MSFIYFASANLHCQVFVLNFGGLLLLCYYFQGKIAESFAHYESLRDIEVPEEPIGKARYYEGIMCFARLVN